MNKTYPQGRALTVVWSFLKPDGSAFSLAGLLPSLKYRTGRGEYAPSGVVIDQSGALTFTIPAEKVIPGLYSLDLTLYGASSIELRVAYAEAFRVVNPSAAPAQENETSENDVESTCSLVTVAEYFKFTPVVPTAGNDGYWYINGEKVKDGSGNPVHTQYTLTVEEDGTIVINEDMDDESEYEGLKDAISGLTTLEGTVEAAEALRVTAENGRVSAESARVSAETARATAEGLRAAAETSRATAETARASAETSRASAETSRVNAEGIRDGNETSRKAAETARVEAENNRATAEGTRVLAEAARATAETSRASAEQARATAESGRAASEYARGNAEAARVAAEGEREAQALADHTQAGADHTQAGTDHTRANTDHATAAADHTQAGSDHTQAGNDHTRAGNDHTQAGTDHSTASSDHTQAGNDHTQAGTDHTQAVADHAQAVSDHESWQDTLDQKANKDGYYEQLVSGAAKNLEAPITVSGAFLTRPTGGEGAEVADGVAQILEAEGNSVKFNQLVQNGNFANSTTGWGTANGTISVTDNILSFVYGGTGNGSVYCDQGYLYKIGHKYYIRCLVNCPESANITIGTGASYASNTTIIDTISSTANELSLAARIFSVDTGSNANTFFIRKSHNYSLSNVNLFDLTAIGIDSLTTVDAVEAWLAENIGAMAYYPYTAGTVLNNCMEGIAAPGYNLLDPATGKAQIIGAYSDLYGNYYGIVGTHGTLTFTDAYGNSSTITPDSDGKFELTVPGELSVASAGADCAVFLWWDGTKKEYEPYELNHGYLDVTHIYGKLNGAGDLVQVWPYGMPRIGDLVDKLHNVDGAAVADRVLGDVDLGSLTYSIRTAGSAGDYFAASLPSGAKNNGLCICGKYAYATQPKDKTISLNWWATGYAVSIFDSAYNNATTFKTAMSGDIMHYELATAKRYTNLVYQGSDYYADGTPVVLPVNYKVSNWSIESIIPKNTSSALVTAPAALTCKYSLGAVDLLNTHTDEIADLYDKKADKDGTYPEMISGNLIDGNGVGTDQEIMFRPTGGGTALAGNSNAIVQTIKGRTLKWNQLVNVDAIPDSSGADTTLTVVEHKIRINGTASATYDYIISSVKEPFVAGHTYLLRHRGASDIKVAVAANGAYPSFTANDDRLLTVSTVGSHALFIEVTNGVVYNNAECYISIFDLTDMFGADYEPSVADFEALFPASYYAYNTGTLLPFKGSALKVTGFNQCPSAPVIFGDNFPATLNKATATRLIAGKTYHMYFDMSGTFRHLYKFFDLDGTPITSGIFSLSPAGSPYYNVSGWWLDGSDNNTREVDFSVTKDCYAYFGFGNGTVTSSTIVSNFCINISNAALNGTYKPYTETLVNIDAIGKTAKDADGNPIVPFPTGVNGAKNDYDQFDKIGGVLRMATISDLSELNWEARAGIENQFRAKITGIKTMYNTLGQSVISNGMKEHVNSAVSGMAAGEYTFDVNGYMIATLPNNTPSTYFSGVSLVYALATPVPFTWDEPLDLIYPAPAGGTEMLLPQGVDESGVPATTPMNATIFYSKDYVQTINNMPKDFDTTASIDALAASVAATLSTALDGTFTITRGTYDATNEKWNWSSSFTPNA